MCVCVRASAFVYLWVFFHSSVNSFFCYSFLFDNRSIDPFQSTVSNGSESLSHFSTECWFNDSTHSFVRCCDMSSQCLPFDNWGFRRLYFSHFNAWHIRLLLCTQSNEKRRYTAISVCKHCQHFCWLPKINGQQMSKTREGRV